MDTALANFVVPRPLSPGPSKPNGEVAYMLHSRISALLLRVLCALPDVMRATQSCDRHAVGVLRAASPALHLALCLRFSP